MSLKFPVAPSITDRTKEEETKGVTAAVDDVSNLTFQRAIYRLILKEESCGLDRSYHFQLIYYTN